MSNPNAHLVVDEMYPCTGTSCSCWFQTRQQAIDHFELFHWAEEQAAQHLTNTQRYALQILNTHLARSRAGMKH